MSTLDFIGMKQCAREVPVLSEKVDKPVEYWYFKGKTSHARWEARTEIYASMAHESLRRMKCFPIIDEKLRAGVSIEKLAEEIQEEHGERTDIKRDSLIRALYRYKNDIPANQLADRGLPAHIEKKLNELKDDIDEIEELTLLYRLQRKRIILAMEQEEQINFLTKGTRKEFSEAREILMALAELKMKLGILDEKPRELKIGVTHYEQIESLEAHERKRLGKVAQILLRELEAATEDIPEAEFEILPAET